MMRDVMGGGMMWSVGLFRLLLPALLVLGIAALVRCLFVGGAAVTLPPWRRPVLFAAVFLAAAAGIAALLLEFGGSGAPRGAIDAADPAQVALGRRVYADRCAGCHGADLEGQRDWRSRRPDGRLPAPPHDASGHTWHHPDGVLFRITKFGPAAIVGEGHRSDMPGFGGALSDTEIRAVLAFIKSTWPKRERDFQERQSRFEEANR